MFKWLFRRFRQPRFAGHNALSWYSFYVSGMLARDPSLNVEAALTEVLSDVSSETQRDVDYDLTLSALLTTDQREPVRILTAILIGVRRTKACEGALIAALEDHSEIVRRTAAQALIDIDTISGLAAVVAGSKHGHGVRTRAAHQLQGHGRNAFEAIPALLVLLRYRKINWRSHFAASLAIAAIGEPAIPFLIDGLRDEDLNYRYFVACALETIGAPLEYAVLVRKVLARLPEPG